jgi:hypothetical protein
MPLEISDLKGAWVLGHVFCPDTRIDSFPNLPCLLKTDNVMDTSIPSLQAPGELEIRGDPETFLPFHLPFFSSSVKCLRLKGKCFIK